MSYERRSTVCLRRQKFWPIIVDAAGQVVSRWGDAIWRFDPWAEKPVTLNFGDGPAKKQCRRD